MDTPNDQNRPPTTDRTADPASVSHPEAATATDTRLAAARPEVIPRVPRVLHDEAVTRRRDRIRWGAVWAGLAVTVGTYLVLQLALVATGAIEIGVADRDAAYLSAGAALLAFLVGGVTTGASAIWDEFDDGILHGIVMWAVAVVALLVLSVVGGNLALGALDASGAFEDVRVDLEAGEIEGVDGEIAPEDAEEAASWALLALAAGLLSSVAGGAAGAKLWPRLNEERIDEIDPRDRPIR